MLGRDPGLESQSPRAGGIVGDDNPMTAQLLRTVDLSIWIDWRSAARAQRPNSWNVSQDSSPSEASPPAIATVPGEPRLQPTTVKSTARHHSHGADETKSSKPRPPKRLRHGPNMERRSTRPESAYRALRSLSRTWRPAALQSVAVVMHYWVSRGSIQSANQHALGPSKTKPK